jgi:hypothetical protein
VNKLELSLIAATSPTLAETMRSCSLRAALSRTSGSGKYVLGNPKGWLGSAYHQVLEDIADARLEDQTIDTTVERLWNETIEAQYRRILTHPLDRRFGSPASWPGYHLTKANVLLRASILVSANAPRPRDENAEASQRIELREEHREREFTACGGKLVGRPDVVKASEIVDFKSGSIVEFSEEHGTETIKAAYIRQLQIYGYLVHAALGRWLQRGILFPAAGPGVEIQLHEQECEREALEAVALLDAYNRKIARNVNVTDLAAPSPETCKWCPYKILCPSFWAAASAGWSGSLDGAAVEGVLLEPPRQIHGGAARALSLEIRAGSEASREINVAPSILCCMTSLIRRRPATSYERSPFEPDQTAFLFRRCELF